jgi:hypothetical protein
MIKWSFTLGPSITRRFSLEQIIKQIFTLIEGCIKFNSLSRAIKIKVYVKLKSSTMGYLRSLKIRVYVKIKPSTMGYLSVRL